MDPHDNYDIESPNPPAKSVLSVDAARVTSTVYQRVGDGKVDLEEGVEMKNYQAVSAEDVDLEAGDDGVTDEEEMREPGMIDWAEVHSTIPLIISTKIR
jgi:hypothetical protein